MSTSRGRREEDFINNRQNAGKEKVKSLSMSMSLEEKRVCWRKGEGREKGLWIGLVERFIASKRVRDERKGACREMN